MWYQTHLDSPAGASFDLNLLLAAWLQVNTSFQLLHQRWLIAQDIKVEQGLRNSVLWTRLMREEGEREACKHGEHVDVMEFSTVMTTKPVPYISSKYLSTLQKCNCRRSTKVNKRQLYFDVQHSFFLPGLSL